jgi:hypothetical protein
MQPFRKHTARIAALFAFAIPVLLGGCSHDLDDCCTSPLTVTYGPAGPPPALGGAGRFCILAGAGVSCVGSGTTIVGDVGCTGGSISGLPPGQPTGGSAHNNNGIAAQGQTDCASSFNDLAGRPCNATLSGVDLGGRTFSAGVYCFATTCQLTGTVTLDGHGNSNAVFVFQVGSSLSCANNSAVVLINGAQAKNVFWQVGSSATLGNNCAFRGNLIALTNITMNNGASFTGRALARNGTVSLDDNVCALP